MIIYRTIGNHRIENINPRIAGITTVTSGK